jgi:hypothetical protein
LDRLDNKKYSILGKNIHFSKDGIPHLRHSSTLSKEKTQTSKNPSDWKKIFCQSLNERILSAAILDNRYIQRARYT